MYCLYVGVDYTYTDVNALAQGIKSFLSSHVWFQAVAGARTYGMCLYVCMHVFVCMYVCMCVCVCMCMCVCIYVCECVCVCMHVCTWSAWGSGGMYACKHMNY